MLEAVVSHRHRGSFDRFIDMLKRSLCEIKKSFLRSLVRFKIQVYRKYVYSKFSIIVQHRHALSEGWVSMYQCSVTECAGPAVIKVWRFLTISDLSFGAIAD